MRNLLHPPRAVDGAETEICDGFPMGTVRMVPIGLQGTKGSIPRKKKLPYFLLGQIKPVKVIPKVANTDVNAQIGIALDQPKFPKKY